MSVNNVPENWEPKVLVFACEWCTYTGADLAGLSRLSYPTNVRILRIPCSGRVNPQFVFRAFQKGIDGVLVCGCHPGDCHFSTGNYFTRRRYLLIQRLLEYTGLDPKRFQTHWISASEAPEFKELVDEFVEEIKGVGPSRKLRDAQ